MEPKKCYVCETVEATTRCRVRASPLLRLPSTEPNTVSFTRQERYVGVCAGCLAMHGKKGVADVYATRNPGAENLVGTQKVV